MCDEIGNIIDVISTNFTSTASINSDGKSRRFLYSAHSFISDHITSHKCYYFLLLRKK